MPRVLERKTVIIYAEKSAASSLISQSIFVPFTPDEVIVKCAATYTSNPTNAITGIWTDLISENNGLIYVGSNIYQTVIPNTSFQLKRSVEGTYSFSLYNAATGLKDISITGGYTLTLEFIKYA